MTKPLLLNADRLFPTDPNVRAITRRLHDNVANLPNLSPHGHSDPIPLSIQNFTGSAIISRCFRN